MKKKVITPTMFRDSPLIFLLAAILIPAGIGIIALLIWYVYAKNKKLTITPKRILYEEGVFSKRKSEINISDIRNIKTKQSLSQRIFGVGNLGISTAGQSGIEIIIGGIERVDETKDFINSLREAA